MGSINLGYTDTPVDGVPTLTFPRGVLNYSKDWREVDTSKPDEVILTNVTSPLDRGERIRLAVSRISNVYQNTGISESAKAPSSKGLSILCQLTNTLRCESALGNVDLPVSVHLVIKVPAHEDITAAVIETQLGRLLSGLYETGDTTTSRLSAIMRGSLMPIDL